MDIHTIPGSKPPSATPRIALTATKDPKLRTNPRHMVMIPQTAVRVGSQILGEAFLMIRLLGTSLSRPSALFRATGQWTHLQM